MHSTEYPLPTWRSAHGSPVFQGLIKQNSSDFKVDEIIDFPLSGDGEHDWLRVRKTDTNTHWVARRLADHAGIAERDVGYSGMKDRQAVTTQWFSVRRPTGAGNDWASLALPHVQILEHTRHSSKLKRGVHSSNRFRIVVRDAPAEPAQLDARLMAISEQGVPNYFGPQRFGRDGGNLKLAEQLMAGRRLSRNKRSLAISAARSLLFNDVLSARVDDGTWNKLLPGEAVNLDGTGSFFVADAIDEALATRCGSFDVHPTGPLWGAGDVLCGPGMEAFERSICEARDAFAVGLIKQGVEMGRRPLRMRVHDLQWTLEGGSLEVSFRLAKGCFATAVLREITG